MRSKELNKHILDLELADNRTFRFFKLNVPEDLDELESFIRQLSEEDLLSININKEDQETIDEFLYYIRKGRYICIIARDSRDYIAGFTILILPKYGWMRKTAEIQGIVKSEYRKLGIAKKLLNSIFQASLTEKIQTLIIKTIPDSSNSHEALESLGFKKHSILKNFAHDIVDRKRDLLIYALDVNEFWNTIAYGKQFGRSMED